MKTLKKITFTYLLGIGLMHHIDLSFKLIGRDVNVFESDLLIYPIVMGLSIFFEVFENKLFKKDALNSENK